MSKKKPIKIKIDEEIAVEPSGVYMSSVTKAGNGATIKFFKKYIGEDVLVILLSKMKQNEKTKKRVKSWYDNCY